MSPPNLALSARLALGRAVTDFAEDLGLSRAAYWRHECGTVMEGANHHLRFVHKVLYRLLWLAAEGPEREEVIEQVMRSENDAERTLIRLLSVLLRLETLWLPRALEEALEDKDPSIMARRLSYRRNQHLLCRDCRAGIGWAPSQTYIHANGEVCEGLEWRQQELEQLGPEEL
ncbi:MAG: hypothetical protein AB7G54_00450 [Methyloceanibacter sp.]